MNLHIFVGIKETYHKPQMNVVAATYNIGDDTYYFSGASHKTSPEELIADVFGRLVDELVNLDTSSLDRSIKIINNYSSTWDYSIFERLINAQCYKTVINNLGENSTMENASCWRQIATSLQKLIELKIKLSCKYKVSPIIISEALICDSAASLSLYQAFKNENLTAYTQGKRTPKDKNKKCGDLPKLIMDNYLFQWLPSTEDIPMYCTINTTLEQKKPKAIKANPIRDRGFIYYSGNNGRLRVAGRVGAEDRYNVTILKEPCKLIENMFEYQHEVNSKIYTTRPAVLYRLSDMRCGGVGHRIEDKDFSFVGDSPDGDLFTLNVPRKDLSFVFNPPRLAFKIKRIMEENCGRLKAVINGTAEQFNLHVTDITDYLYVKDDAGKVSMHKHITTSTKNLPIVDIKIANDRKIKMKPLFKYDMPTRNEFNRLIKDNPKVEIVTWLFDDHIVSYSFVISTDEGYTYYSSEYGSRHLLPTARKSARK